MSDQKQLNAVRKKLRETRAYFAMHLRACGRTKEDAANELGLSVSRVEELISEEKRNMQRQYFAKETASEADKKDKQIARAVLMLHEAGFSETRISEIFGYGYICHGASLEWAHGILGHNAELRGASRDSGEASP